MEQGNGRFTATGILDHTQLRLCDLPLRNMCPYRYTHQDITPLTIDHFLMFSTSDR